MIAAVVTLVLTASVLLALAPPLSHRSSTDAATAARPEVALQPALVTYSVLNGYGITTNDFYPGELGWGTLYFVITDTLDRTVNVTITDPNAARDGVASPAYQYVATLNTTTSTFDSYTTHVGYAFPSTLLFGGTWNVNFSAPNAGSFNQSVSLFLYYTQLSTSVGTGATLPGEPLSVFWWLFLDSNGATLYTHATNVWISGTYLGNGTLQNLFPQGRVALTPASSGRGQWNGLVPANVTPNSLIRFEVSAITNVSGQIAENESANTSVAVGILSINDWGVSPAPPNCSFLKYGTLPTGTLISSCLQAGASYFDGFTPISGLPVTVNYWNGTVHATPTGAPTQLSTDASGEAAFTFLATVPPFSQSSTVPILNALNFTVNVPGAGVRYAWTQWLNATWTLRAGNSASGIVQVSLDHTEYYVGATATVAWSVGSSNITATGPVSTTSWEVTGPNAVTYESGTLNGTAPSGTFTFPVTAAMAPYSIEVWVFAANATAGFANYAVASVLDPSLLLTAGSTYYSAGSTATVTAVLNGGGSGATIDFEVWGYWASQVALLASGTVANGGNIQVPISSTVAPLSIQVTAWGTVGGQVIATGVANLLLEQGYSILLGVTTASSYSDGSYQPGQGITLSYQVVAVGGASLPQVVTFELYAEGYPVDYLIQNVGPSGSLAFTVPSNAVQGTLVLVLAASGALATGPCFPVGPCSGVATLSINPHPSVLNLELGPGSGLTVGWLVLLILVIAIAVALFLVLLRRGRWGPKYTSSSSSGLNPPAPPPSSPPAAEWTPPPPAEPPTGDLTPPRLPEPPVGPS